MDEGQPGKWKKEKKKKKKKKKKERKKERKNQNGKVGFARGISDYVARQSAAKESYDLQDHYGWLPQGYMAKR